MEIFTDGSCDKCGNGAFAIVIHDNLNDKVMEYTSKCFHDVTNNQMELYAIIQSLKILVKNQFKGNIIIYSDSEYCIKSINQWLSIWIQNDFNRGSKKEIKNIPLWEEFVNIRAKLTCNVTYKWVKGHANNEFNNLCDRNAVRARTSEAKNPIIKQ